MGLSSEDDPERYCDASLRADDTVLDLPMQSHLFGGFESSCDFGSVLSSHDLTEDPLNGSLLNKGVEGGRSSFELVGTGYFQAMDKECDPDCPVDDPTKSQDEYQHNTTSVPLGKQLTGFSPTFANSILSPINTNAHLYRPSVSRPPSQLRNEYNPDAYAFARPLNMPTQGYPQHMTSSPSHYISNAQRGMLGSQGYQSFQETNMRPHTQEPRVIHQMGYNPSLHASHNQSRSVYPDLSPVSHVSHGLSNNEIPQGGVRYSRRLDIPVPSTPPNTYASHVRNGQHHPSDSGSSPCSVSIKHEVSAAGSPLVKKVSRKAKRRKGANQIEEPEDESLLYAKSDGQYIEELMEAMTDETAAEDNPGMQATWNKIRDTKLERLQTTCVELLNLIKRAQQEQLGDKKPVHLYPDFDHRFRETCAALRTQKTVCKHLMEAPYSHTVANDPTYAAQRVRNNRRVNGQKRQAISMGRQALGLRGQGKGKSIQRVAELSMDDLDDDENSDEDAFGDDVEELYSPAPPVKIESGSGKKARIIHQSHSDDEYVETPPSKKHKRRSAPNGRRINKPMSSKPTNGEHLPAVNSSPAQRSQPVEIEDEVQHQDYFCNERPYASTAPSLPPMLPEFYGTYNNNGPLFNQFAQHSHGYSSPTSAGYSGQHNDGSSSDNFEFGTKLETSGGVKSSN